MHRIVETDTTASLGDPGPGRPLSVAELGEHAAHLVWESYSDFLTSEGLPFLLQALEIPTVDGIPEARQAREFLVFHLWAHTRAMQLGLMQRGESPEQVRASLDHMHRAFYHDLEATGVPAAELPLFEEWVGTRYMTYHTASREGGDAVGRAVVEQLYLPGPVPAGRGPQVAQAAARLTLRAIEVAGPFRDYLEESRFPG